MLARPHDSSVDGGTRKSAPGTQRLCAVTGEVRPIEELTRFVVAPDGSVVPDLKRRLPGRGIWITATRHALRAAMARNAFARGFKRDVRVASDLVATTEGLIERAALDALAICHKAGKVAIGFANVEAVLARARRRTSQCCASRARWRTKARGRAAPPRGCRRNRGCRCIYLGAIGFGIGAVKCGTCSPARRS